MKNNITVITHSRKKFYYGKPIYWYEFLTQLDGFDFDSLSIGNARTQTQRQ